MRDRTSGRRISGPNLDNGFPAYAKTVVVFQTETLGGVQAEFERARIQSWIVVRCVSLIRDFCRLGTTCFIHWACGSLSIGSRHEESSGTDEKRPLGRSKQRAKHSGEHHGI